MKPIGYAYRYYNHQGRCMLQSANLYSEKSCKNAAKRNLRRWNKNGEVKHYKIVEIHESVNFILTTVLVTAFDPSTQFAFAY